METITPTQVKQRILIEGCYKVNVSESIVKSYFSKMITELQLKTYSEPVITSPAWTIEQRNQGIDAHLPMLDSGFTINIWTATKYLSVIFYSCDTIDGNAAYELTKEFFKMEDIHYMSF